YDELTFLEPGGRASIIRPSSLPAPMHTGPSFLAAHCLDLSDKFAIAAALVALTPSVPRDDGESFLRWLQRHGQTQRAIDRFWTTILVSALNEDLDRISVPYAAHVIRESFLMSKAAGRMGVPAVPLTALYAAAGDYIRKNGGEVRTRAGVNAFLPQRDQVQICSEGHEETFDYAVLAVSFDALSRLLPEGNSGELGKAVRHFESSPITGIHLWFDREISELDHAVLLDRTIQWMFHKSRIQRRPGNGSYVEVVVSASKTLIDKSRNDIIDLALRELREFFPAARDAQLLKAAVIKEVHATYAPLPGIDRYRLTPATEWPRVFVAGDWIDTGWPATMEGAVRSGYLAAQELASISGNTDSRFLVADLPAEGLMRLFGSHRQPQHP
ncbi:MAG: FAD-dependent oxidoreductase, partial [Acidobacteriales bacterium]|nr:FAD-dependent oxidoreductase [Terriglobales bacterium]